MRLVWRVVGGWADSETLCFTHSDDRHQAYFMTSSCTLVKLGSSNRFYEQSAPRTYPKRGT